MRNCVPAHADYELDYFTASPDSAPLSIEGMYDSVISAAACLKELEACLNEWDGVRAVKADSVCRGLFFRTPPLPRSPRKDECASHVNPERSATIGIYVRRQSSHSHHLATLGTPT